MLHQQIESVPRIHEMEPARSFYAGKEWSKKYRRWRYIYEIVPPTDKKLFPADAVLVDMLRRIPGTKLKEIIRDKEFDRFFIVQARRGVFSARASLASRKLMKRFLSRLGQAASGKRSVRPLVLEGVERFLTEHGFVNIEWNGRKVIAYKKDGHGYVRYESRAKNNRPHQKSLEKLHRLCAIEPPFSYGAALT